MSASLGKRLFTAPFWRLEPLLARILDELASGEPLRSRRVVVISHLVRDRLQALLARTSALAGVSFLTLGELVREPPLGRIFRNAWAQSARRFKQMHRGPRNFARSRFRVFREKTSANAPRAAQIRTPRFWPPLRETLHKCAKARL